jgi:integrase
LANITRIDTRPGLPRPGRARPGAVDINQWNDKDYRADVGRFIVMYGRVGSNDLKRACSEETITARRRRLESAVARLAEAGHLKTLSELRPKLIPAMLEVWDKTEMKPRSQVQAFSVVKWFWKMHGMDRQVGSIKKYAKEPNRYIVHGAAQQDRSVSARVEEVRDVFKALYEKDERAGYLAFLAWAAGLRRKECLRVQPHEDFTGPTLEIRHGAKGGRERSLPLDQFEPERQKAIWELIDQLRRITPVGAPAGWPGMTLAQSMRRLRYLVESVGLTKAQIGATFHGLRHDYAIDGLQSLSGFIAPVRGGLVVNYEAIVEHQKVISRHLGHNRPKVTAAYYGSVREMQKLAKMRLLHSWQLLQPGLEDGLAVLHKYELEQLYLTGQRASGTNSRESDPFDFAIPGALGLPADLLVSLIQEVTRYWSHKLGLPVLVAVMVDEPSGAAAQDSPGYSNSMLPLYQKSEGKANVERAGALPLFEAAPRPTTSA